MSTPITMDEERCKNEDMKPGSQLAQLREKKNLSQEYVAGKLHLTVSVIKSLEADDYTKLPEAVFIQGYLQSYAKLLGVSPEPYLLIFDVNAGGEKRVEKTLWQSKKESNKSERIMRWITGLVTLAAILLVCFWWQTTNRDEGGGEGAVTENTLAKGEEIGSQEPEAKPSKVPKINAVLLPEAKLFTSDGESMCRK